MVTNHGTHAVWIVVFSLFTGLLLRADPDAKPSADSLAAIASSLKWQTGTVTIKDALAKIDLTIARPEELQRLLAIDRYEIRARTGRRRAMSKIPQQL